MGYRSDIRVLLPEEEFNVLDAKLKSLDQGLEAYDVKQIRIEDVSDEPTRTPKKYVYFGWSGIKWYNDFEDVKAVEEAVSESEDCHFVRYGESWDDFEETYNLQGCVENIQYYRGFEDDIEKLPCPHCSSPFSETTLIYRNGELLVNTSIDFCPKCGKKQNGGKNCA